MAKRIITLAIVVLYASLLIPANSQGRISYPPLEGEQRTLWFSEAKFGIFIHWGPYAVIGHNEWARHLFQIPQAQYDGYAGAFNPVNYDPDSWVDLAQAAGAKYIVITSKHHDGFSIYRSKTSDYDMEITPYSDDPLKMLADACRRKNMRLGFYHSIMDWHHPDYRPRRAWEYRNPAQGGNNLRYIEFMKAQLRELLTEYGDVAMMWFDGEWEETLSNAGAEDEIYDFVHGLQPNTLINDRLYRRQPGSRADFGTPEQFVPATGVEDPSGKPVLWESCVTMTSGSWGYDKYETEFKTERELIRMLVEVVSKGGNLLLNVGPTPDGRIQPEFVTRLNAIGKWMDINEESIYETTASPFSRLPFFGRATAKKNILYLHVFQWPSNLRLRVPGLKNMVHSAHLLAEPAMKLAVVRENDDVIVSLPDKAPDETASVVVLILDGEPVTEAFIISPEDETGILTMDAASCEIQSSMGQRAKKDNALGHVFVTNWTRAEDVPTWSYTIPEAGRYKVEIAYGAGRQAAGTEFAIEAAGEQLASKVRDTGNDWVFKTFSLGEIELPAGDGTLQVKVKPSGASAMQLEKVVLRPAS